MNIRQTEFSRTWPFSFHGVWLTLKQRIACICKPVHPAPYLFLTAYARKCYASCGNAVGPYIARSAFHQALTIFSTFCMILKNELQQSPEQLRTASLWRKRGANASKCCPVKNSEPWPCQFLGLETAYDPPKTVAPSTAVNTVCSLRTLIKSCRNGKWYLKKRKANSVLKF